ncbi:reverse transcriptase domain-containing protein [Tanacetum coccineum]
MANTTPIVTTVTKAATKEKTPKEADAAPRVRTRLDLEESSKKMPKERNERRAQNSSAGTLPARYRNPSERPKMRDRLRSNDGNVFGRLGHRRTGSRHRYHSRDRDRSRSMKRGRESESPLSLVSESGTSDGGHYKSKSKRRKPTDEEDLAVPWSCEENRRPRGSRTAKVWFDELPPKSIDGYKDLKVVFLAYFMQQKKYVKDPVEIHNIKQRDRETIEDFMERFKVEIGRMKGAPECMRISGFMHRVNNPELAKRLNEHVPKTMEEMMTATTAFIRGKTTTASKKKGHTSWKPQDQPKWHVSEWKSDF